jgi:hypothetical protein
VAARLQRRQQELETAGEVIVDEKNLGHSGHMTSFTGGGRRIPASRDAVKARADNWSSAPLTSGAVRRLICT